LVGSAEIAVEHLSNMQRYVKLRLKAASARVALSASSELVDAW
jgi:hypothetical protein